MTGGGEWVSGASTPSSEPFFGEKNCSDLLSSSSNAVSPSFLGSGANLGVPAELVAGKTPPLLSFGTKLSCPSTLPENNANQPNTLNLARPRTAEDPTVMLSPEPKRCRRHRQRRFSLSDSLLRQSAFCELRFALRSGKTPVAQK